MTKTLTKSVPDNLGYVHQPGEIVEILGEPRKRLDGDKKTMIHIRFSNMQRGVAFSDELV